MMLIGLSNVCVAITGSSSLIWNLSRSLSHTSSSNGTTQKSPEELDEAVLPSQTLPFTYTHTRAAYTLACAHSHMFLPVDQYQLFFPSGPGKVARSLRCREAGTNTCIHSESGQGSFAYVHTLASFLHQSLSTPLMRAKEQTH